MVSVGSVKGAVVENNFGCFASMSRGPGCSEPSVSGTTCAVSALGKSPPTSGSGMSLEMSTPIAG